MNKTLICLLLLAMLGSCTKNDAIQPAFSFSVGGSGQTGDLYTAVYRHDTTTGDWSFTGIFYIGDTTNHNYLQLNFVSQNTIVPGTYAYGQTYANSTAGSFTYINGATTYSETSGNFQVSQIDSVNHKISGSFQFGAVNTGDAANTISISNGKITNVNYTVQ